MKYWLQKFLNTYLQHDLYESIDVLPAENWFLRIKRNNNKYLIRKRRVYHPGIKEHWTFLQDEAIKLFGINDEYGKLLNKKKEVSVLIGELAKKMHPVKNIRMNELRREIEKEEKEFEKEFEEMGLLIEDNHAAVEKYFGGVPMDLKIMSTARYFSRLKQLRAAIKEMQKQNGAVKKDK